MGNHSSTDSHELLERMPKQEVGSIHVRFGGDVSQTMARSSILEWISDCGHIHYEDYDPMKKYKNMMRIDFGGGIKDYRSVLYRVNTANANVVMVAFEEMEYLTAYEIFVKVLGLFRVHSEILLMLLTIIFVLIAKFICRLY